MNNHSNLIMALLSATFVLHTTAVADIIVQPSDLDPGDPYRLVYVTSHSISGNLSEISTYNSFVDEVANNLSGFTGSLIPGISTWDAIISTGALSARENISALPGTDGAGIPIYNILGERLANNYADFWDATLANDVASSVAGTERNTAPPSENIGGNDIQPVWTGTASNGTTSLPVGAGTTTMGVSMVIPANGFADSWVQAASRTSTASLPVYGISSILTASAEPITFMDEAVFDVKATPDGAGGFTLTEGDFNINVQKSDFSEVDRRGVLEFDISSIPHDQPIFSASILYQVIAITSDNLNKPMVRLFGYEGNGIPDPADAEQLSNLIGVSDPIDELGLTTIDIDPAFVQSLLGQTDFLGVTMLGSENGHQFGFGTLEAAAFWQPPKLTIVHGVPEPSSMVLMVFGMIGFYAMRRRRKG